MAQRIAGVSRQAVAHRPLPSCIIVARHTDGIGAARIRVAEVLLGEGSAADKGIAGHVARTAADGRQAAQVAVGSNAAGALAGVLADAVEAGGPSGRTVRVAVAFRPALGVRTADVALGALADRPVVGHGAAGGTGAALTARGHALEVAAHVPAAAVAVVLALVPAAAERVAQVAVHTGAGGHAVDDLALGVDAARAGVALLLCGGKGIKESRIRSQDLKVGL